MPGMQKLIEAGLFGRGLVPINNEVLVRRYNEALIHFGLKETTLQSFHIDRMGWSPEIANETGNNYYLSHGEANPLVIVLTPDQASAPIYFPMHSFDWSLTEEWYRVNAVQIAELTKDCAVCLDIDQEVDIYVIPEDLLSVNDVTIKVTTTDGLMDHAAEQRRLVKRWLSESGSHFNQSLIKELEANASTFGDLRHRRLVVKEHFFSDVRDFYSRAFGGVFVLRSMSEPLLLVRNHDLVDDQVIIPAGVSAVPVLMKHGYIGTDVAWWKDHLYRLDVVAESFLIDVLEREEPELDYGAQNEFEKKKLVQKYKDQLDAYLKLVRIRGKLQSGTAPEVEDELQIHLLHPSEQLCQSAREVIWQLLTYIRGGRFVPLLYRHQKTDFLEGYTTTWNRPRRSWARARVREYYDVASKSSGSEL